MRLCHHRRSSHALLAGALLFATAAHVAWGESPARTLCQQLDHSELIVMPVGSAAPDTPVEAVVHREALLCDASRTSILLVGPGQDASRGVDAAMRWFYESREAAAYHDGFVVSALPLASVLETELGERAERAFPPASPPFQSPRRANTTHLWRWLGMFAPDLVVTVDVAGEDHASGWFVPDGSFPCRDAIAAALLPGIEGRHDELATALTRNAAGETGSIPALRVVAATAGGGDFLPELLAALRTSGFQGPSPARRELRQRMARSPIQVAGQLSEHYGHELKQVHYIPALALVGRLRLGELVDDESHLADVQRVVARFRTSITNDVPRDGSSIAGHLVFAALADRTTGPDRDRYIALARLAADLAFQHDDSPELMPYHNEMSDALFMGGPILAEVGRLTGEQKYYDACLQHLRGMRRLVLREDGLYRHSPLNEAAWGRGNGFPALGLAWCLSCWPEDRAGFAELREMFRQHMSTLITYQDESGCWHQVIDHPNTYRELSSTCMITFALVRGMRRGWLDTATYRPAVERAWDAIRVRVPPNGRLVDVCTGTGKQKTLRDYYQRPAILGPDARGGAMALLAATELARGGNDLISP